MRVHGFRNYGGEKHYLVNQRKGNKVYIPEWMTKLEAKEYSVVSMPCIGLEALLALRRLLDSKLSSIRDNTSHEIRSHGDDNENLQTVPNEHVSRARTKRNSNTADRPRPDEGITGEIDDYGTGGGEEEEKKGKQKRKKKPRGTKRGTQRTSVSKGGRT
jgi:hypothetical protein